MSFCLDEFNNQITLHFADNSLLKYTVLVAGDSKIEWNFLVEDIKIEWNLFVGDTQLKKKKIEFLGIFLIKN